VPVPEVESDVCAYAKPIAPTMVAAATAVVNVLDAVIVILLRGERLGGLQMGEMASIEASCL